ncbi:acyltransferase [Pontibacter mangrovi]|uniref:Acyltransferase n=1 Tax=Pontibacter mangrovi TaxID=2589816 RepID=A0A501W708_9BACT|nr:acyltransferase [Pontibacter mangrovi]
MHKTFSVRVQGLDFLRGIAVIGVMLTHTSLHNPISRAGWMGVDLFFVLSGFLVSGLIFTEYKQTGAFNIRLFLIRRGFKIYPSFYFFIAASILLGLFTGYPELKPGFVLDEVIFIQNYRQGLWWHTWSLAVEEHFYIFFAGLSFFLIPRKLLPKPPVALPLFVGLYLAVVAMRVQSSLAHQHEENYAFFATHLRSDGILLGVILSYLYHFAPSALTFARRAPWPVMLFACLLISPAFLFTGGEIFMNTVGTTTVHFGFCLLVLLAVQAKGAAASLPAVLRHAFSFISTIGLYSYTVYLWHIPVLHFMDGLTPWPWANYGLYFLITIILGAFLSLTVEKYFLRIRELYFPKPLPAPKLPVEEAA